MLSFVDFNRISDKYLVEVHGSPLLDEVSNKITTALCHKVEQSGLYSESCLVLRSYGNYLYEYVDSANQWNSSMKVPSWMDARTASQTYRSSVVMVGALNPTNGNNAAMCDLRLRTTIVLPKLPISLQGPGVFGIDGHIYVIGGATLADNECVESNQVFSLDMNDPTAWSNLTPMNYGVRWPLVSSNRQCIFVFGGELADDTLGRYVQIYNQADKQWSIGKDMPAPCYRLCGGCVLHNDTFVIITSTVSMIYDYRKNTWDIHKAFAINNNRNLSIVKHNGRILACGTTGKVRTLWRYEPTVPDVWRKEDIDVSRCVDPYDFYQLMK